jgi:PPE-repeat protein
MDFVFLPPEVNSARMYAGPGAGPLLAAAGSWDSVSAELNIAAGVYESVLATLTGLHWRGPTSEAMSAAAAPYVSWLHMAADQAEQTAMQARAAAAAFELAYAMTIPPIAVGANRIRLAVLIATNFFGQNAAAIAATEAQYAEYWAQDATAMFTYSASSTAATQLTPFASARLNTDAEGLAAQQDSVEAANIGSAAGTAAPQAVSAATALPLIPTDLTILNVIQATGTSLSGTWKMEAVPTGVIGAEKDLDMLPATAAAASEVVPAPQLATTAGLGDMSVTVGRAGSIGSMSVPASWAAPTTGPLTEPVTALSRSAFADLPETGTLAGSGSGVPGLPGMRPPWRPTLVVPRYGVRVTVMTRPPCAG